MNRKNKNLLLYMASFLIPLVLLLAALAYTESVPFGTNSILWRDAEIQYIDYVAYLRSVFRGENDFLYSFSKNMGDEMVSLLSYYLASPFNLLFALASNEMLPAVFTAVAVLKMALCGLSFFHASTKLYGCKLSHLAFSTGYALMAYNVLYGWSIMWLDGVLVLPLVGLGLYELWGGKKPWLYIAGLAYSLFTNFYIGYMLCIASVLFSLVHMVMMNGTVREKAARFGRFLTASCLGGFATAFLWLPTFLALMKGRASIPAEETASFLINFNIVGLAGKVVAGAASFAQVGTGTPHIFCGTLVLFLVMVFFLNRGISPKIRLVCLSVLAVLLVSFLLRPINIIWHAFTVNFAFNFRYAFIFSYVMLMIGQYALSRMDSAGKKEMGIVALLIALLIGALLAVRGILGLDFVSAVGCITSLVVLLAGVGSFVFGGRKMVCALLVLAGTLEMGINCCLSWDAVISDPEAELLRTEAYDDFHQQVSPAVEYVKSLDSGFYRMEKTVFRDINDPMFFEYNGLSHFSSSQQKRILDLLEKMGLKRYMDRWSYYNQGSTAEVDALLGVKYVLSQKNLTEAKGYEKLDTVQGLGIYENKNVLPIVFLSQPDVLTVNMEEPDYFALHNEIWSSVSGISEPVLHAAADVTVETENLEYFPIGGGNNRYVRIQEDAPAAIRYRICIDRQLPLYFYFTSPERQDAEIFVNGVSHGRYFNDQRWDMSYAGTFAVGQTVEIEIRLTEDQVALGQALFYHEDGTVLNRHTETIKQQPVTVAKDSSSRLSGSFEAKEGQLLLFTVPYDTGWKLYVDGQPCQYTMVLDALIAAQIPEGVHSYELRFVPQGGIAGCGLTAAAVFGCALWYILEKKKGADNGKKA